LSSAPRLTSRTTACACTDVVGQEHVVRTLSNAVEQGKVTSRTCSSARAGTGKTSMAKILARLPELRAGPTTTPCGVCESCVSTPARLDGRHREWTPLDTRSTHPRAARRVSPNAPVSGRHKIALAIETHDSQTPARRGRRALLAVQAGGEDLGHRRLARAARADEQVRVVDLALLDRVGQGADDVLLPDDVGEGARAVAAVTARGAEDTAAEPV